MRSDDRSCALPIEGDALDTKRSDRADGTETQLIAMWLCTQLGFFSIVQKDSGTFHIRARCREDLDRLALAAGTGSPVASHSGSDYPWRILCPAADLPRFMSALAASIDYGNFKSAIAANPSQRSKLSAYYDIHHRMVEWQQNHPSPS